MYHLFGDEIFNDEPNHRSGEEWSEIGQVLRDNGSIIVDFNLLTFCSHCNLQRKIYRQRAWTLLDSADYYPEGSISRHFPTLDQLMKQV